MKKVILYISGSVQRAGYRTKAISLAELYSINGIVSNLPDGRVKIVAEGNETDLEQFIIALDIRNALINVTNIDKDYSTPFGEYEGFYKLVSSGETDDRLDTAADLLKELIVVIKDGFNDLGKKQDVMIEKQDVMIEKQDVMIEKQDVMIGKQDTTIEVLKSVKEDTSNINNKISSSKEDIKDIFYEKYDYLAREIIDIKANISEIKAKVM
jgi:acylphosphatase